jgi:hypothetical protein
MSALVDRVWNLLRSDRIVRLLYERLLVDSRIKALEPFDWSARLQGVSVLAHDMSRRGRCSEYFSASDITIWTLFFAAASPEATSYGCPATGCGRSILMMSAGLPARVGLS